MQPARAEKPKSTKGRTERPRRWWWALLLIACLHPAAAVAAEEKPAGRVKNATGSTFLIRGDARTEARPGDPVFQNDILETGSNSSLGVTFRDESRLSLGPDTRLIVDEYVYQPEGENQAFISRLVRGTLLYVSGVIAKLSPDSTAVETPDATIGIRGTRFLVRLVQESE